MPPFDLLALLGIIFIGLAVLKLLFEAVVGVIDYVTGKCKDKL